MQANGSGVRLVGKVMRPADATVAAARRLGIGVSSSCAVMLGMGATLQVQAADEPGPEVTLEQIVVTAQRRSERLQDVPISVSAVSAQTAQQLGVFSTQDVSVITPGLQFQQAVGNASPFIRGIGTQAVGAGQEASVATYIDGVYIAAQPGSLFSLNNVERIEVLKGPQGTLFGRNATGGLIQVVTRDPSADASLEGSLGYANFDTFEGKFYGTTGIGSAVAADLAAYYSTQGEGWGTNLANGSEINRVSRDLALRSKWLVTPSDDTRITLSADYSEVEADNFVAVRPVYGAVQLFGFRFSGDYWDVNTNFQPYRTAKLWGTSLKVEQSVGFADLVSISAYRNTESHAAFDQDSSPLPILNVILNSHERQFSQELQLLSDAGSAVKWIVGAYYFRNEAQGNPTEVHIYPALTHAPGLVTARSYGDQETESIAGYAQATVPIAQATNLTLGGRYTRDRRTLTAHDETLLSFAPVSPPDVVYPEQRANSSKPTWRVALDHHFGEDVMTYVSYDRGFKSGTFNLEVPSASALQPETIDAYELGTKIDAWDRRLRLDVATFYYEYKDIQLTRTITGTQQLLNAGSSRSYGLDLELAGQVTDELSLRAGLALLNSEYTSFPDGVLVTPNRDPVTGQPTGGNTLTTFDAKGKRTIRTPDTTYNFTVSYEKPLRLGTLNASATYYWNAGWYAEADNRVKQPSYNLVSSQITWSAPSEKYRVRLWGRNLTNAKVAAQVSEQELTDGMSVTAPRTYGVAFEYSL